ncbi:hypothetical protein ANCCAN_19544, partial [Ancylostoma caninum]
MWKRSAISNRSRESINYWNRIGPEAFHFNLDPLPLVKCLPMPC